MREDITFHSQEIEIRLASDLKGGLVGSFKQLNADGSFKAFADLPGDTLHQRNAVGSKGLNVGNIVTVLEDDYVGAQFDLFSRSERAALMTARLLPA